MPLQERLTLSSLPRLDFGKVEKAFQLELERMVKDCEDRPLDEKPRIVMLAMKLTPEADTNGQHAVCDNVHVECEVTGKVPVTRSRIYTMKPKQDGSLIFSPDLPEEPDQAHIMDEVERRDEERRARAAG